MSPETTPAQDRGRIMHLTRTHRRSAFAVLAVLAMLATVLAAVPAAAGATGCDSDYVSHHGDTWYVSPNGTDDTANLACVFGEAAGNPDADVRLAEGVFHVDFLLSIGFQGRIIGAGTDATSIEPLEGGLDCVTAFETTGNVAWMAFGAADVVWRDLTLNIPGPACAEPWIVDIQEDPSGETFGFIAEDFEIMVLSLNRSPEPSDECGLTAEGGLKVVNVHVNAPVPNFGEPIFNPEGAFSAFTIAGTPVANCEVNDDLVGRVVVKDSSAHGVGNLLQTGNLADSVVRFKRNKTSQVDTPVSVVNAERSLVQVRRNHLEGVWGAGVVADNCFFGALGPDCLEDTMHVRVLRNTITTNEGAFTGVGVFDNFFVPPQIDAKIRNNHIDSTGALTGMLLDSNYGALVGRNTFTGASPFGVIVGGETSKSFIGNNDMTGLTAFEAGILLDELTSNNRVKDNAGATVIDLGTGNIVTPALAEAAEAFGRFGLGAAYVRPDRGLATWSVR
jgi:hypothetical protein